MTGFLSRSWHIESHGMFAASCIGVGLLVVSLEFLRRIGKEYDVAVLRQFQQHAAPRASDLKVRNTSGLCRSKVHVVTFRASPAQQLTREPSYKPSHLVLRTSSCSWLRIITDISFFSIIIGADLGKFFCDWTVQKVRVEGLIDDPRGRTIEDPTACWATEILLD